VRYLDQFLHNGWWDAWLFPNYGVRMRVLAWVTSALPP
jgi:hypothetical protein